jgi:hypothetical protein
MAAIRNAAREIVEKLKCRGEKLFRTDASDIASPIVEIDLHRRKMESSARKHQRNVCNETTYGFLEDMHPY